MYSRKDFGTICHISNFSTKFRLFYSAGNEFPLTGQCNTSAIQSVEEETLENLLSDEDLFGSSEVYREAMEILESKGSFQCEKLAVFGGKFIHAYTTHPSIKNPWKDVSIRCIETVNYDIVDISHPMQGNRMYGSHHEAAILVRNTVCKMISRLFLFLFCSYFLVTILIVSKHSIERIIFHTVEYSTMRFLVQSSHTEEGDTKLSQ